MATVFLLLVCVGTLLGSAGAQEAYDRLPSKFKLGVDMALEMRNSRAGVKRLLLYFKGLGQSDIQPGNDVTYIYHNFYMKATQCPKGTVDTSNCPFRENKPEIDCAICYKTIAGKIQASPKPYINCIRKPALTEAMKRKRVNYCNEMGYSSGAPGGLADIGDTYF
ncbi:unnamed protein product [Arctogadus glacialis]